MARRRTVTRRQLPQRKFIWAREVITGNIVPAEDSTFANLLSDFQAEYGANLIGATVMRIRGRLEFFPASTATAVSAAAIKVESESVAFQAAVLDAHGPFMNLHDDWMAYEPLIFRGTGAVTWDVDVKSNRKLEELGETLVLSVSNPIVGVTITYRGILSIGLKLP